jgi:S1-C subfamily serine protease
LDEKLKIQPSDTWNVVAGKAIALRQLGRTTDAVAAFSRYGDMFAATDPTAQAYARTAQQFTTQLNDLGVEGGVYLYQLVDDGAAKQAGLAVADVVISYGERSIKNMDTLVSALRDAPKGEPLRITYLRMQPSGQFLRQTTSVVGGTLGAGFMPI